MKTYTASEFRKNVRKILNEVASGEQVEILRYDDRFVLGYENAGLIEKKTSLAQRVKEIDQEIIQPKVNTQIAHADKVADLLNIPGVQRASELPPAKLCKIHGIPLDDRGRCMQKGCKYA